jgi:hypothetical protein
MEKCNHEFKLLTQGFFTPNYENGLQSSIIQCVKCLEIYRQDENSYGFSKIKIYE